VSGWVHVPSNNELLQREKDYLDDVVEWITVHFPHFCRSGKPHPAAVAAVLRLHGLHGRGSLTCREHGEVITAAVRDFDARVTA
jgi:hypothetical protein